MNEELKGTGTEAGLMAAYASECMSSVKYRFYADKALGEGYPAIAAQLSEIADQEQAHAKVWFSILTGAVKSTETNLLDALKSETYEYGGLYERFASAASREDFPDIAALFRLMIDIEKKHESVIRAMFDDVRSGNVYEKPFACDWVCGGCGFETHDELAPEGCPLCGAKTCRFSPRI